MRSESHYITFQSLTTEAHRLFFFVMQIVSRRSFQLTKNCFSLNQLNIHVPLQFREMHKMIFVLPFNALSCMTQYKLCKSKNNSKKKDVQKKKIHVFCRGFAEIIFITRALGRKCHWKCTNVRQGVRGWGGGG